MAGFLNRLNALFNPPPPEPEIPEVLRPQQKRADGWVNPWTGIGTGRDKTLAGFFVPQFQLPYQELIALFNSSAMCRKVVLKPAREMYRRGFDLKAEEADPDEQKLLEKKLADLQLTKKMMWGQVWGRLFGGALTIMGAMDGQTPDQPLNEDNISSFEFLNTVDRRYVWVQQYYSDPMSPKYGMPELYLVTNMISGHGLTSGGYSAGAASTTIVHETRVIRWDGNETDDITRQQLAGWTFSVLQTVYDTVKKFEHAYDSVGALLSDASQAVFKMQGLIDAITSGDKEALQMRMAAVDMARSTLKAVLLDAEGEEFTREATPFGGIADLLDRFMTRLCADVDIPRSELFGESPGGMNTNAQGELRKWYDSIASDQMDYLGPLLKRVVNLVSCAADSPISDKETDWDIAFRPLWSPTDLEDAQYRLAVAQADAIYLTNGVVTPEQVALGRWGGNKFGPNIQVDASELQDAIDGKVMADPYENEPPPEDPSLQGGGTGSSPNSPLPVVTGPRPSQGGTAIGSKSERPTRPTKKKDAKDPGPNVAKKVYKQLLDDYPANSITWVKAAQWTGDKDVALDRIDFSDKGEWKASRDGEDKIDAYTKRIEAGKSDPIILVDVRGEDKLQVVDGHHRLLAYKKLGLPARAYVASVQTATGPWSELHTITQTSGGSSR